MPTAPPAHPLARLTGDEIKAARQVVLTCGRAPVPPEDIRFAYVGLFDPPKETVRAADRGERVEVDRQVRMVGEDLFVCHARGKLAQEEFDGDARTLYHRFAEHDLGINGNAFVNHTVPSPAAN